MSYKVYKVSYVYPTAPTHYVLFVETDEREIGSIFHVRGDVLDGMEFEIRGGMIPRLQRHFSKLDLLGTLLCEKLPRFIEICESIPAPGKQLDAWDNRLLDEPLYCCKEWLEDVIRELKHHGILENVPQTKGPLIESTQGAS